MARGKIAKELAVADHTRPSHLELPAALRRSLEQLLGRINNDTAKRELWGNRFTAADRRKFSGTPREILRHNTIQMWHVARGTPTWNECIVEVAYALGFINAARREALIDQLGARLAVGKTRTTGTAAIPHWDDDARELRYRGQLIRVVKRPKQANNIVTILRAFQAAGWPKRIVDPFGRKPSDETRRRDIENLNKLLLKPLLKFACDGNGTGFLWKSIATPKAKKAAKRRR
jgi:hypothetical protein